MCDFQEINRLVGEWEGRLLRYAEQFLRNPAEAQDAVQDAYIRYIRCRRDKAATRIVNPSAWLFHVTRNICLDVLKSSRLKKEIPMEEGAEPFSSFPSPDTEAAKSDEIRVMRELIEELSPREQELLSLKFEQSKRYEEIAEIMNISIGNVGFRLHETIEKLKKNLRARENGGLL